jgi:hypothetical protein
MIERTILTEYPLQDIAGSSPVVGSVDAVNEPLTGLVASSLSKARTDRQTTQLYKLRIVSSATGMRSCLRFPSKSGTPVGELIGSFLRGEYGDVAPEFLALASRPTGCRGGMPLQPISRRGDRAVRSYVASNIAFQASKKRIRNGGRLEHLLNWFEVRGTATARPRSPIVLVAPDAIRRSRHLRGSQTRRDAIRTLRISMKRRSIAACG